MSMSQPPTSQASQRAQAERRPDVVEGRLWAGGLATAVVAALVAAVVLLVARGVFGVPVLVQNRDGQVVTASLFTYAGLAALGALVATALMDLLLHAAPKPFTFFTWIVLLATFVAGVLPLTVKVNLDSTIATIIGNLLIGFTILAIIPGVARSALRRAPVG
jgi:hypothetical protein